jgi:hypothetical protein
MKIARELEGYVTENLESVLGPAALKRFRDTDRRYRAFAIAGGALRKQAGIGPAGALKAKPLREEVESRLGDSWAMPTDKLDDLERFVSQADQVAGDIQVVGEGGRFLNLAGLGPFQTVSSVGPVAAAAAPLAALAYSKFGQRVLKGNTPFQKALRDLEKKSPEGTQRFLRALGIETVTK